MIEKKCENCLEKSVYQKNLCKSCYQGFWRQKQKNSGIICQNCLEKPIYAKDLCQICYRRNLLEKKRKSGIKCKKCLIKSVYSSGFCCPCYSEIQNKKLILDKKCEKCGKDGVFRRNRCKSCYNALMMRKNILDDVPVRKRNKNGEGGLNCYGYRLISVRNHPNNMKNGRIFEHVFVMSEFLKRPLYNHENIHHKNGIRDDNRIENLELWSTSQPKGQRVEDKIKWAKEFLKQYE